MALTNIEKVRLQTGDRVEPYFITDDEIESFLEEYNDNIRKTSVQVASCILFQLAANPSVYRERTGEEEVYTTDPFNAYKEALINYIKNPHIFLSGIMPYAAGLTKSDEKIYNTDPDNNIAGSSLPNNSNKIVHIENLVFPRILPVIVVS